ncbi:hypothetical protein HJC23_013359 [Cyclotella cryptica]|uniref:Uncharacterized protein n=1 Tax=Cyclotella cryptica TaxID=29204 RepID=A0ABD3P827_9STRA
MIICTTSHYMSVSTVHAFLSGRVTTLTSRYNKDSFTSRSLSQQNIEDDLNNENESNGNTNEDLDWRAFRAQLVRSEQHGNSSIDQKNCNESTHWAYDSGDFVERGSVVISIPSSDPVADDIDALNNQCYRKSIVLVLDVKSDFIQGIILNRPTNIRVMEGMKFLCPGNAEGYENEIESCGGWSPQQWKVWFGGEALGLYSDSPQVMCLHSVQTDLASRVSEVVLPSILMTSFEGACAIVKAGEAKKSDFWLFCGICGWESSSFYREMHEEGLWRIVSSDGGTILEELNLQRCEEEEERTAEEICDVDSDSRNAGIHTWEMLMDMIGRTAEACESEESFGDLMLREWATGALSFSLDECHSSMITEWPTISCDQNIDDEYNDFDVARYDPATSMAVTSRVDTLLQNRMSTNSAAGTLIRASSARRSPFLLSDQGYHKSLVLILRDDNECSEGVILNHVTDSPYRLDLGNDRMAELTVRYGGPLQDDGEDGMLPMSFLHARKQIANAGMGSLIGNGLFRCTEEETINAINMGLATSDDFMAIQGISVWEKNRENGKVIGGVLGDIREGFFELVSQAQVMNVWGILKSQNVMSSATFEENISLMQKAWHQAGVDGTAVGYDTNEENVFVFGSEQNVATLADEALRRWVKLYFLDDSV